MNIRIPEDADATIRNAARILRRAIAERCATAPHVTAADGGKTRVELKISRDLGDEAFRIVKANERAVAIIGGDGAGLIYGCGRFLRQCRFANDGIEFGASVGLCQPRKKFRGIFFAVHNHNYYQNAPVEEVCAYIEELALWGVNRLAVFFHMFEYRGWDDPKAKQDIARLNAFFEAARGVGMKTVLIQVANDGFLNSPEELRYDGGDMPRNWGTEICPSKPEGMQLIKRESRTLFGRLDSLDYVVIWPYDSGGCMCTGCRPWGTNGFLRLGEEIAGVFRECHPEGKVILSTWYFDYNAGKQGEWDNLFKRLDEDLEWVDMVLADGAWVNGDFPRQAIERRVPRPVVSFLEISMRTGSPWGGFGVNPMPEFIRSQWALEKDIVEGGIPYSEGIYEDVNKVIWAQLCWNPDRPIKEIMEEYAAYEFAPDCATEITEALYLMEPARGPNPKVHIYSFTQNFESADKVWESVSFLDRALDRRARRRWRWRQVFLRAQIDAELRASGGNPTPAVGRANDELFDLYRLDERSLCFVRPLHVIADGNPRDRKLKAVQEGKTIFDICDYRKRLIQQTTQPSKPPSPVNHGHEDTPM